jgi:MATE family multidrug resistance protein
MIIKTHIFNKIFPKVNNESTILTLIPLIISQLSKSGIDYAVTIVAAFSGYLCLASLGIATSSIAILTVFCYGILSSIGILLAHNYAKKDILVAHQICFNGFVLATALATLYIFLLRCLPYFYIAIHQDITLTKYVAVYFNYFSWGVLPSTWNMVLIQWFIANKSGFIVTLVNVVRFILVIAVLVIVYKVFSSSQPTIMLNTLANVVVFGNWIALLLFLFIFGKDKFTVSGIKQVFALYKTHYIIDQLKLGIPFAIILAVEIAFFAASMLLAGAVSEIDLAIYNMLFQYIMLCITIPYAVSQATSINVAHNIAIHDSIAVNMVVRQGILFSALLILPLGYFLIFNHALSVNVIFNKITGVVSADNLGRLLNIVSIIIFADIIRLNYAGALRGLKDTKIPMLINIMCFWLLALPVEYYLCSRLKMGVDGILYGMLTGIISASVMLVIRFEKMIKHSNQTISINNNLIEVGNGKNSIII